MEILKMLIVLLLLIIFLLNLGINIDKFENWNDDYDCHVITMKNDNRIKNIEEQQKKCQIKINIFDAFNGNTLSESNYKNELKEKGLLDESNGFKPDEKKRNREIGCYLSHLNIYKMIKDKMRNSNYKKKYTIIFEDDVKLDDNFMQKLKKGMEIIKNKNFDLFYLGTTWVKAGDVVQDNIHTNAKEPMYGTFAYIVNNNNIDKIINLTEKIDAAIDVKLDKLIKNKQLNTYYFYPRICWVIDTPSLIN